MQNAFARKAENRQKTRQWSQAQVGTRADTEESIPLRRDSLRRCPQRRLGASEEARAKRGENINTQTEIEERN